MNYVAVKKNRAETNTERPSDIHHSGEADLTNLILNRVRLRARRRATWLAYLSGSADHIGLDADPALIFALDDRDQPETEEDWYQQATHLQVLNAEIARNEEILDSSEGSRLTELAKLFYLNKAELDVLQACYAVAIDPTLGAAYAYLQQHSARTAVTAPLVARLFGHGHRAIWSNSSSLAIWGLIEAEHLVAGEVVALRIDPFIVDWLNGELRTELALLNCVKIIHPQTKLTSWPVDQTAKLIEQSLQQLPVVRIQLNGLDQSARHYFAAATAEHFNMQVLTIEATRITDADWPDSFMRIQRLAILARMALLWEGDKSSRLWPVHITPAPIQFISSSLKQNLANCNSISDQHVEFPALTVSQRLKLWQESLPQCTDWTELQRQNLAMRYRLNIGDITSISACCPNTEKQTVALAREKTRHHLSRFGCVLDCPFTWDDLVISRKLRTALQDFTFEAQQRITFWEQPAAQRLFPRGKGLTALFSGPPGTGKTMAVQVMAAELNLDLVRVDLASVVSKYIGETAKNLGQIFINAQRMNAILFFDEADALFSRRTDVKDYHDRHANADTGYLLQLLEDYDGIVILASNKKQNIDPAFTRRLRYMFNFPRPEAVERKQILSQLIAEMLGDESQQRLTIAINTIADEIELSGAQIKNALLAAIFISRQKKQPLQLEHLLDAIERELGKEGRTLASHEREGLTRNG